MDPKNFKRHQAAPAKTTQRREAKPLPEWNNLQHDHTKYRLTAEEVEQKREQRKPRPRGQEPLLGDKYISAGADELSGGSVESERQNELVEQMVRGIQKKHADAQLAATVKRTSPEKASDAQRPSTTYYQDRSESQVLTGAQTQQVQEMIRKSLEQPGVNEAMLARLTQLSQQMADMQASQTEMLLQLRRSQQENERLRSEMAELQHAQKVQEEMNKAGEFQALEEVLQRLKYL